MLTLREADVLRLLAGGCTYGQIGERLGISAHTVRSHIKNAYRKLGVHTAAAAVMRAVQLRILGEEADPRSRTTGSVIFSVPSRGRVVE